MRLSRLMVVLLIAALAVSCSGEKRKIENVVTVYNDVLIDAYLEPNPRLMVNFVSTEENVRISSYIASLGKDNKILDGNLVNIDFKDTVIKGDTAEVITKERWVYSYLDAKTRGPVSKEYDTVYSNVYYLKKKDGRWVVDRLDSKELPDESISSEQREFDKIHKDLKK